MAGIKDYSSTASSNTSVGGVSIAEGMLPSNINNAFRAVAADIREWYNDSQWVIYGDGDGAHTFAYASGTSFTVNGANVTAIYEAGRRIKAVATIILSAIGSNNSPSFDSCPSNLANIPSRKSVNEATINRIKAVKSP